MTERDMSATEALALAEASRAKMAAAADCPPARHLAFALLLGGVVAVQAAPGAWNLAGDGGILLCVGGVVAWDRARKGVFVNGYRAGRTRPLTLALVALMTLIMLPTYWLRVEHGVVWAPLLGGAVLTVVAWFASARWSKIYRRELEAHL